MKISLLGLRKAATGQDQQRAGRVIVMDTYGGWCFGWGGGIRPTQTVLDKE